METLRLLSLARDGDMQAARDACARQRERVQRACALRVEGRSAAELAQETCNEAAARLGEYFRDGPLPFQLWLRRLLHEKLRTWQARPGTDRKPAGRPALPTDVSATLVQSLAGKSAAVSPLHAAQRLRQAFDQLELDERNILLWRHFERLNNRDVSMILGVAEPAAAVSYIRVLERLRGLLGRGE